MCRSVGYLTPPLSILMPGKGTEEVSHIFHTRVAQTGHKRPQMGRKTIAREEYRLQVQHWTDPENRLSNSMVGTSDFPGDGK